MRHKVHKHSFGRKPGARKALIRGLVYSLVEHGRIKTTVTKAKELRRHVEKAITKGKEGTVHARRLLMSRYPNEAAVSTIVDDLAKRFQDRPGGYTRITKLGPRVGDMAEMAYIEFVDYEMPEATTEETVVGDEEAAKRSKVLAKRAADRRKARRKMQSASRQANR